MSLTTLRVIWLRTLDGGRWLKLDAKLPVDWENDEAIPATAELQLGKNISRFVALYVDGLLGIGADRPYDWGVGTGLRFKY